MGGGVTWERSKNMKRSSVNFAKPKSFVLTQIPVPDFIAQEQKRAAAYKLNTGCTVMYFPDSGYGESFSIAHPNRYPNWDEVAYVREQLLSANTDYAMLLPRGDKYVNIHPNCFQVWECYIPSLGAVVVRA